MSERRILQEGWFEYFLGEGVDENKPGIYKWTIDGAGSYIGKYKRISRPKKEYGRNVQHLIDLEPYRKSDPEGYRRIHRALESADREKRRIELLILENVDPSRINARERELIQLYGTLNGTIVAFRNRIVATLTTAPARAAINTFQPLSRFSYERKGPASDYVLGEGATVHECEKEIDTGSFNSASRTDPETL